MDRKQQRKAEAIEAFGKLVDVIDTLRAPGGCPWDRKQTPVTLKPYIIEEAYEVLDAIDSGKPEALREELGDLLLQVMLQSQISYEDGSFHVGDVATGLTAKMIHRHPHVFGDTRVDGADEVASNWEKIKSVEKQRKGLFDGLPASLPGVLMAFRMGQKAARVGFDWPDAVAVREKVIEELGELDEAVAAGDAAAMAHEVGDLLFAVTQWARHLGCDPEEALRSSCSRFRTRFTRVEGAVERSGRPMEDHTIDELEALWQEAKTHEQR